LFRFTAISRVESFNFNLVSHNITSGVFGFKK